MQMTRSLLLLGVLSLQTSCVDSSAENIMYVCVGPKSANRFMTELDSILRSDGFRPSQGQSVDASGRTLFALEADKNSVRVWAQNAPAEPPREMPELESLRHPGTDPYEYVVSVQARAASARYRARETFIAIRQALAGRGFVECPPDERGTEPN